MELSKLIDAVNENHRDEGGINFPRIIDSLPTKMKEQRSDIAGIETEWIWQVYDQFDCYQGELAYQIEDGRFLIFEFYG